jgi:hypothetical protein
MSNPLLLAVISRVLAGSIPHQPNRSNATDLVRTGTAPAGAVPAHEHFNRELNLLIDSGVTAYLDLASSSHQTTVACLLKTTRLPTAAAEPSKPETCLPGASRSNRPPAVGENKCPPKGSQGRALAAEGVSRKYDYVRSNGCCRTAGRRSTDTWSCSCLPPSDEVAPAA